MVYMSLYGIMTFLMATIQNDSLFLNYSIIIIALLLLLFYRIFSENIQLKLVY
jgi:hypothetical protein